MKELTQDKFGIPHGNCYATAVASIFELDLQRMPRVPEDPATVIEFHKSRHECTSYDASKDRCNCCWTLHDFYNDYWWTMWDKWFRVNNLKSMRLKYDTMDADGWSSKLAGVFHVMSGRSPRDREGTMCKGRPMMHSVVGRAGVIYHDPHPDRTGLTTINEIELIIPCDPSQPVLQDYRKQVVLAENKGELAETFGFEAVNI